MYSFSQGVSSFREFHMAVPITKALTHESQGINIEIATTVKNVVSVVSGCHSKEPPTWWFK